MGKAADMHVVYTIGAPTISSIMNLRINDDTRNYTPWTLNVQSAVLGPWIFVG